MSRFFAKPRLPDRYSLAALLLLAALAVVLTRFLGGAPAKTPRTALLERLPDNGPGVPTAVISALKGEFPEDFARLIFCGRAASTPIISPFMPILDAASAMSVVVAFRENGAAAYGAFTPTPEEYDSLRLGTPPESWRKHLASPELRPTDRRDLFQLIADDLSSPLYIALEDEVSFVADSLYDVDRIMAVSYGAADGIKRKWSVEAERGGHIFLSDGGVLRSKMSGSEVPNPKEALEIEVAWATSSDIRATRADWRLWGAEHFIPKTFLNDLRKDDWSQADVFVPDPLVLALGINLPDPGKSVSRMPFPLKYLSEQLRQMGLRAAETAKLLTGRTSFAVGGRTRILWFDLPGLVIDMSGRGEASFKMIEKFWDEKFFGVEPVPVEGFEYGGFTRLPFTALAAANSSRALLGLVEPDAEQSYDALEMLSGATDAAAWIYIDFPRLGSSLADIPELNSMLYADADDEEIPLDEESANSLKNAMSALGIVFITCESAASGAAVCYY
jgi:hypothetical protein